MDQGQSSQRNEWQLHSPLLSDPLPISPSDSWASYRFANTKRGLRRREASSTTNKNRIKRKSYQVESRWEASSFQCWSQIKWEQKCSCFYMPTQSEKNQQCKHNNTSVLFGTNNTHLWDQKEKQHTESVWKGSYPFPWLCGALRKCLRSAKQCKGLRPITASPHVENKLSRTNGEKKRGKFPGSQKRSPQARKAAR